jgi:hypothetical protein
MIVLPMAIGTLYAELIDLCRLAQWEEDFPAGGSFRLKTIRGRDYWYFQSGSRAGSGERDKYVGPDSDALQKRIAEHRQQKAARQDRRTLVQTLVRGARFPAPPAEIGNVLQVLERAGVFRLRGCLVGTLAYQTYAPLLGARLADSTSLTSDIDIAQFYSVSIAIAKDETTDLYQHLRQFDDSFRAVSPPLANSDVIAFANSRNLRVDILTPNQGSDDQTVLPMPALGTDAVALRFLDFLIHEPIDAVVLHDSGIAVTVPAPERYAVHKLIISGRRHAASVKAAKDVMQGGELILALFQTGRWTSFRRAFEEACGRGPTWRELVLDGLSNATDVIGPQASGALLDRIEELRAKAAG